MLVEATNNTEAKVPNMVTSTEGIRETVKNLTIAAVEAEVTMEVREETMIMEDESHTRTSPEVKISQTQRRSGVHTVI